jgi:hypothetical protein
MKYEYERGYLAPEDVKVYEQTYLNKEQVEESKVDLEGEEEEDHLSSSCD